MGQNGLISMSEIADLAGVQRAVVSVWRRRHSDTFPKAAGGDANRPLFDGREIAEWLVATGRAEHAKRKRNTDVQADLHQFTLAHLATTMAPKDLVNYATALICLRMMDDEPLIGPAKLAGRAELVDPNDDMLLREIRDLPDEADGLPEAMDNLIEAAWGCKAAFERLLDERNRIGAAVLARDSLAPQVRRLIAKLTGARGVAQWRGMVRVVDPWADAGDLLAAVLEEVGEEGAPLITASTADDYSTRLLRRRLAVWGVPQDEQDVVTDGATRVRGGEWDILLARARYQVGHRRLPAADLMVLGDLAQRLQSGQCAVMLTSADLLADQLGPTPAGIRARLLRSSAVEAVITLPAGVVPFRPGYRTALWVMRHDESGHAKGRVMLADASAGALTPTVVDQLVEDITTWRREGYHPLAHRRSIAHPVTIGDILDGHAGLRQPRRPEATEAVRLGPERVAMVLHLEAELAGAVEHAPASPLRSGVIARDLDIRRTVTIGTMVLNGSLVRVGGARLKPDHITPAGHHRVIGAPEVLAAHIGQRATAGAPPSERCIDRAKLAERYPRATLTEPGDVVVALSPQPTALVDERGFSVVEFPATVLRLSSDSGAMTPRVLAALVESASRSHHAGRPPRGIRLDQLHLPRLGDDEMAALDDLLERAEVRRRRARQELDTLDALCDTTLAGLADGTLTFSTVTT